MSDDGTLVVINEAEPGQPQMVWLDLSGNELGTIGEPENLGGLRLSPDGSQVAVARNGTSWDLWIYETRRGVATRLTSDPGSELSPAWTPDGRDIVYRAIPQGCSAAECMRLMRRRADGTGKPDSLARTAFGRASISPDGRLLLHSVMAADGIEQDLAQTTLDEPHETRVVVSGPGVQADAVVGPQGSYVAYTSGPDPRHTDVFLSQFPSWHGRWQVSAGGGARPRWNGTGNRLFYSFHDAIYEVNVALDRSPTLSAPRKLFEWKALSGTLAATAPSFDFDVAPDGRRFIALKPARGEGSGPSVLVMENWYSRFMRSGQ